MIRRLIAPLVLFVALLGGTAHAQWLNHPSPGIPRTAAAETYRKIVTADGLGHPSEQCQHEAKVPWVDAA
jgi:hypothetical protein